MDMKDYLRAVKDLASNQFHKSNFAPWEIAAILELAASAGDAVDVVKKSLFYNKPINELTIAHALRSGLKAAEDGDLDQIPVDTLHGILGVISEGAELADALKTAIMTKQPIDTVNVREELGDLLWYVALGIHSLGESFDSVTTTNMEKLWTRYPEKRFSNVRALNRDLDAERGVLEA